MVIRSHITRKPVCLGCGNVQIISLGVFHCQVFANHTIQFPEYQPQVATNAVVNMHHPIIFLEIRVVDLRCQHP